MFTAVAGVKLDVDELEQLDLELYSRAAELLRSVMGEKLDLPYENYVDYEIFTEDRIFPPRATVYVDVSKLVGLEEKYFYPAARISLYFIDGKPIAHVYKRFSIIFGGEAEDVFRQELLSVIREVLERGLELDVGGGLFSREDKIELEIWLEGDEVYEAKKRAVELVYVVL